MDFNLSDTIYRIRIISFILSIVFGALAAYFIVQFQKLIGLKIKTALSAIRIPQSASGGATQSCWEEILRHMDSSKESQWKLAIIEADKLIDNMLKLAGYSGETMGDRLMNIEKGQFLSLDALWEAHKIRNKLVHDLNYFLRYAEARRAMEAYRSVMEELGAIQ